MLTALDTADRGVTPLAATSQLGWHAAGWLTFAATVALMLAVAAPRESTDLSSPLIRSARVGMTGADVLSSSDPAELGSWLEARAGYAVEVPAISSALLIGGRVADLNGVPTASATYVIAGNHLTYFDLPNELRGALPADEQVRTMSHGEFNIAMWTAAESVRALVARIGSRELVAVAQECRRVEPKPH